MKERMKENGWIGVCEALPKIDTLVDIIRIDGTEEVSVNFKNEPLYGRDVFLFRKNHSVYNVLCWRYPVEKRPDFSKLREWDLLVIENENVRVGYFHGIEVYEDEDDDGDEGPYIDLYQCKGVDDWGEFVPLGTIKKITRINLEDKTFEDI